MSESSPEPSCEPSSCDVQSCRPCRFRFVLLAIVLLALGVTVYQQYFPPSHNTIIGPSLLTADAKDLKSTIVTPHLEAPIQPGQNVLWCSTFQLVWSETCRIAGGDVRLENEPPIVPILNKKTAKETDVDATSCLVASGRIEDGVVRKIREDLIRKFAGQANPDLLNRYESDLPPEGVLAYAYLFRQLPFRTKFRRLDEPLDFGDRKVTSFGLRKMGSQRDDHRIADQVKILDYQNDDDFVVELKPKDQTERIVLAKIAPGETLQATIDSIRSRTIATKLKEWDKMLAAGESIVVPILNFDVWQQYDALYGKVITTPGPLAGMPIVLAVQDVRFRIDESGAILKSEVAMADEKCAESKELPKPRQFIFDKPFLILLERRDAAQPYFALWVDNPELLAAVK